MGSTGTGKFTDYPGSRPSSTVGSARPDTGGTSGEDKCEVEITRMILEDVATCPYYQAHGDVPLPGTDVTLLDTLYGNRLAVATDSCEIIGLVPTQFNYLRRCIADGHRYEGEVTSSSTQPLPSVEVTLRSV